jgi:hypothetical protein
LPRLILEPLLDELGQPVKSFPIPVKVLSPNAVQWNLETARKLILLGVSLSLLRLVMLWAVELHREQWHLINVGHNKVEVRLESEGEQVAR